MGLLLDAWDKAATREGGELAIDIDDHSQRLTLDIVTSLAFNKDFKQVEGIDAQLNGEGDAGSRKGGGRGGHVSVPFRARVRVPRGLHR